MPADGAPWPSCAYCSGTATACTRAYGGTLRSEAQRLTLKRSLLMIQGRRRIFTDIMCTHPINSCVIWWMSKQTNELVLINIFVMTYDPNKSYDTTEIEMPIRPHFDKMCGVWVSIFIHAYVYRAALFLLCISLGLNFHSPFLFLLPQFSFPIS